MKRAVLQVVVAFGVLACLAIPVSAAEAGPYGAGTISLSTEAPAPGGTEVVDADGFLPNSTVKISISGNRSLLTEAVADANGLAHAAVTIPATLPAGSTQTITAEGTGADGSPLVLSARVTLAEAGTAATAPATGGSGTGTTTATSGTGSLPRTGASHLDVLVLAGLLALAFGAAFLVVSRRRRHALGR